jgi:hypothetical protein
MVALAVGMGWVVMSGCFWSKLERDSLNLLDFQSWGSQATEAVPDSLIPTRVPVAAGVTAVNDGSAQSVQEISLFVQLRNELSEPNLITLYAHPQRINDKAQLREEGVQVMTARLLNGFSAFQIDARNYPEFATGFDGFAELILSGDFYLYVIGLDEPYRVSAGVPAISMVFAVSQ